MVDTVRDRYGIAVEVVSPDPFEVREMVERRGMDLFYESVAGRELCCEIRKVRPLAKKLKELRAWATGLRPGAVRVTSECAKGGDGRRPSKDLSFGGLDRCTGGTIHSRP